MPVPLFLQNNTHVVAVHSAIGDTRLAETLEENNLIIPFNTMTSVGVLLDADNVNPPAVRYAILRDTLRARGFAFPDNGGQVLAVPPRMGAFVLPDNNAQGTLEHVLMDCAREIYPTLLATATVHVDAALGDHTLTPADRAEISRPAGRNKAIVGSIASILRPGRAIQVSIQDNRWLRDAALNLPSVRHVQKFLADLLELS